MNHSTQKRAELAPYSFHTGIPDQVIPLPQSDAARQLQSTMGQTWLHNTGHCTWHDQYGFIIRRDDQNEMPYALFKGTAFITRCHRLHTAKLMSTIMINDIILHKSKPDSND